MNELLDITEVKKEATDLGITFSPNIGAETLQKKIDAYYESQETSGKEIQELVEAKEKSEENSAETDNEIEVTDKQARIQKMKADANKTKVVTIIDNDQRVNNQTTTCTVNCSNMYFDLGTIILPLNMAVEVRQGHLNVLKEIKIPQHTKDHRTGLSVARMIPRYTISMEENKA